MGRRVETTAYLKDCMANALISLMQRKPISKIKLQEITDLAKVGQATYFRHFNSREDLLEYKLICLWTAWTSEHPFPHDGTAYEQTLWFFCFCDSIRGLLRLFYEQSQNMCLINAYLAFTKPMDDRDHGSAQYKRMFYAYGIHGIVMAWEKNGFRESPEELTAMCLG